MKAVVLEKSGSRYTVLAQDGTFRQVYRRLNAEVGEEVQIQRWLESFSGIRLWAGVVAIFLLVLTTFLGWTLYQAPTAVALLSVDINPRLQFELDYQGHLVKFQTQNEDAKRMLSKMDLKGKPIEEVLKQIVTQAYAQKLLSTEQPWVVVGYSPMTNKTLEQMPKELNENLIISWITEIGEKKGLTPEVAVFSLSSQERELAQKGDLTLGEYALWQTANKAGVVTQPEKLKDTLERVRLLENPQVQAQIKAEKMGLESGLPRTPGTAKQDLGTIGKPPVSPITIPNVGTEKGKEQGQKETENKQNNQEKAQGQAQTKELGKTMNSVNKEPEQAKVQDHVYVPALAPLPTLEESGHDACPDYKIPERQDEGKMNDKSGRAERNNVDH